MNIKWCGSHPGKIKWSAFKKDIAGQLQPWQTLKRVEFRWCIAWCVFNGDNLVMEDGSQIPVIFVHNSHGALVGSADPYQPGSDINSMSFASEKDRSFFKALWDRVSVHTI